MQRHDNYNLSLPLGPPLEDLASPVWLLDRKGAVVGGNRAARALEGEAGRPLPLLTPSARHILAETTGLRRAVGEGRPLEVWARTDAGRRLRVILEPLHDAEGRFNGALLVALDAAAGRARSLLKRLLVAASRELHGPLAPLATFSRLARRAAGRGNAECAQLYLERLDRHVERLQQLVGEMHDLIETFHGDLELRPRPFDLAALIRAAVDRAALRSHDHRFEITAPAEAVVVADEERLGRVLDALLSNAVRFSPAGSRVQVAVDIAPRQVVLTLDDGGHGIPADRLADLFDGPGWDEEPPRGGLGLGLYLAREVVERHGGSIRAEPLDDHGTRMVLTLPRLLRA